MNPARSFATFARPAPHLATTALGLTLACAAGNPALAQTSSFEPRVGQEGKDVVWVPTPAPLVERMLDMADLTPSDRLIDLGSGDGRTVIAAARRGAQSLGVEYNPDMVALARRNAEEAGVADLATFVQGDLFETDLSKADVITMFLLPSINEKLSPTLFALEPGTRIVSNSFRMGDWQADRTQSVDEGCERWCNALLWIVPAKVDGVWQLDNGRPLYLQQTYQTLEGTLDGTTVHNGKLHGNEVTFRVNDDNYVGRVDGNTMSGAVENDSRTWRATRQ